MFDYDISFRGTKCTISNLKLTKDEKFELPRQAVYITELTIEDSTIPRLTEDLIGAFANLWQLYAENSGIEEISEEAFVGCKNLTQIYLRENKIKALEPKTFNRNTKLEVLWLNDNQLDFLPKELFLNLENLKWLYIDGNNLTSLSKKLFTNLKNLEKFYVSGNQLTNVKIEEIMKQCPKLYHFHRELYDHFVIYDNDFSLAVLENIQKHLKDAGVYYNLFPYNYTLRSRHYATQKLNEVEYIPEEEYERLMIKKENRKLKKKIDSMEKKFELMQREMETLKIKLQQSETSTETKLKLRN